MELPIRYRRVGSLNCPLLRKRKMTLLCISSRLVSGQTGVRPEGRQILYFLPRLSATAKEKTLTAHWYRFAGLKRTHEVTFKRAQIQKGTVTNYDENTGIIMQLFI